MDRHDIVSPRNTRRLAALGWHCDVQGGDIFDILPRVQPDIVTANLFLHHFDDTALARLLAQVAASGRAFVACEPRRGRVGVARRAAGGCARCQ